MYRLPMYSLTRVKIFVKARHQNSIPGDALSPRPTAGWTPHDGSSHVELTAAIVGAVRRAALPDREDRAGAAGKAEEGPLASAAELRYIMTMPETVELATIQKRKRTLLSLWLPVVLYAGLIFLLSSLEHPPPLTEQIRFGDKMAHALGYGVFGFLLLRGLKRSGAPWPLFLAWGIATLYGVSDELHQYFVPGRDADLLDLLADSVGALVGGFAYLGARRWLGGDRRPGVLGRKR
jgi:VanZ family protein